MKKSKRLSLVFGALSAVGVSLSAVAPVSAAICATGSAVPAGNGVWGNYSTCSCGTAAGGLVRGQFNSGSASKIQASVSVGGSNARVAGQTLMTASSGGGTFWMTQVTAVPNGGAPVVTVSAGPDWFWRSPYYVRAQCSTL